MKSPAPNHKSHTFASHASRPQNTAKPRRKLCTWRNTLLRRCRKFHATCVSLLRRSNKPTFQHHVHVAGTTSSHLPFTHARDPLSFQAGMNHSANTSRIIEVGSRSRRDEFRRIQRIPGIAAAAHKSSQHHAHVGGPSPPPQLHSPFTHSRDPWSRQTGMSHRSNTSRAIEAGGSVSRRDEFRRNRRTSGIAPVYKSSQHHTHAAGPNPPHLHHPFAHARDVLVIQTGTSHRSNTSRLIEAGGSLARWDGFRRIRRVSRIVAVRKSDLEGIGRLGSGGSGNVYKVRHRRTGHIFAVKTMRLDGTHGRSQCVLQSKFLREEEAGVKLVGSPWVASLYVT